MKKEIVLIEDDEATKDIIEIILTNKGYHVSVLDHGPIFKDAVKHHPDLFVIDKNLGETDGIMICRHLKSNNDTVRIPVIMISSNPAIGSLANKAGADAFLEKPFSRNDLASVIDRLIPQD